MKKKYFLYVIWIFTSTILQAQNFADNGVNYSITDAANFYVTVGDNQGVSGSIVIPESVTYNGQNYAVTSIKDYAFSGSSITGVTIPNAVIIVKNDAFASCTNLISISIGNSVTTIEKGAFYGCTGITSVIIPDSVTSIGLVAFFACTNLTNVTLGSAVVNIGDQAFAFCHVLSNFTITTSTPPIINVNVFEGLTLSNIGLFVPSVSQALYHSATIWKDFNVSTLGLTDLELTSLKMYPNPVAESFRISLPNDIKLQNVTIYDTSGKLITFIAETNRIDIKDLSNGSYYVVIETSHGKITKKLIKK